MADRCAEIIIQTGQIQPFTMKQMNRFCVWQWQTYTYLLQLLFVTDSTKLLAGLKKRLKN